MAFEVKDIIAVYGAVVATLSLSWNIINSRSRIKVHVLPAVDGAGETLETGVVIATVV